MTDSEIAWAAGIFEGEGCFALHDGRRARALLAMTDQDIVERFAEIMGFGTRRRKRSTNPRHQEQFVWAANSRAEFERVVELFTPWLGERRLERVHEILSELHRTDHRNMTCAHCGKTERVATRETNSARLYCSTRCAQAARHARDPEKRNAYMRDWRRRQKLRRQLQIEL